MWPSRAPPIGRIVASGSSGVGAASSSWDFWRWSTPGLMPQLRSSCAALPATHGKSSAAAVGGRAGGGASMCLRTCGAGQSSFSPPNTSALMPSCSLRCRTRWRHRATTRKSQCKHLIHKCRDAQLLPCTTDEQLGMASASGHAPQALCARRRQAGVAASRLLLETTLYPTAVHALTC